MDLKPTIKSEVSQKEKDKYRILMHIYRLQKNGTEEFIYRATVERHRKQTYGYGERGGEGEIYEKTWKLTLPYVKYIANGNLLYGSGNQTRALYQPRVGWCARWEGGSKRRGYMHTYG